MGSKLIFEGNTGVSTAGFECKKKTKQKKRQWKKKDKCCTSLRFLQQKKIPSAISQPV